jgi:glycosyltransferase involved in cell wall biosynthesis
MKILYVACRWDPTIQDEYSGSDYGAYHMIKKGDCVEVYLVGPFEEEPSFFERIFSKFYRIVFKKRLIKYFPSTIRESGKHVNQAIQKYDPDVIFSKYSAPMVHAKITKPFVYMCDSTIQWTKKYWPEFSKIGFKIMGKWEEKSLRESDRIVTFSHENADIIHNHYHKDHQKIKVMPIPAYIPDFLIPPKEKITKTFGKELQLLLVGKRYHLRGVDIAIDVCNLLNKNGIPAKLRIAGMEGENLENVEFLGVYNKENLQELSAYYKCFETADLLIHPSRFHAAGIVISEAAAFGVPTITNNVGGLGTSVLHNLTGIVLPESSKPEAYTQAIIKLIHDQKRYNAYQTAARERFDKELNWEVAGQRLLEIIQEVKA